MLTSLLNCRSPQIAAVNGLALAGGMEILADLRLATPDATFALTEASRGIIPGGGSTVRLARQIPFVEAMRILLTGEAMSAEEALRVGFVNELVPRERLLERAFALAERIAGNGPLAVRKIKESVVRSSGVSLEEGYAIEDAVVREVMRSEDAREGPRAFMEKTQAQVHRALRYLAVEFGESLDSWARLCIPRAPKQVHAMDAGHAWHRAATARGRVRGPEL